MPERDHGVRNLAFSNWQGANLEKADLSWCDLSEANFEGANLAGANLSDSHLNAASFRNAILSEADLSKANAYETDFTSAELTGAVLEGVKGIGELLRSLGKRGEVGREEVERAAIESAQRTARSMRLDGLSADDEESLEEAAEDSWHHSGFPDLEAEYSEDEQTMDAARPDHRPAQLVEPSPGRLVAAQPEHPLQAQGTDAVLLAGDEPHRQEPHPQRLACVLEHRAGCQRCAPMTTPAPQQPIRHRPRLPDHSAVRAGKTIRPTEAPDILPASRVAAEPLVHLLERPWVINPTDRMLCAVHPLTLPSPRRSVKGIPIWLRKIRPERSGAPRSTDFFRRAQPLKARTLLVSDTLRGWR